nr:hypothetical protein [uncultured Oscillibacter sp.]
MRKTYHQKKRNSAKCRKNREDLGTFRPFSVSSDKKGKETGKDLEKILGTNSREPLDFPQKFDIMELPLVKMCKGGGVYVPLETGCSDF